MTIAPLVRRIVAVCQVAALLVFGASLLAQGQMVSGPPAVQPKVKVEEVLRIVAPRSIAPPKPKAPVQDEPWDETVPRFKAGQGLTSPEPITKPGLPTHQKLWRTASRGSLNWT